MIEPPQGQLPRYPRGPAGRREWRSSTGGENWHWWTVLLAGLVALAVSGFLCLGAAVASGMSCFDTCGPARRGMSLDAVGTGEGIVFIAAGVLLLGGLINPAWRRVVVAVLSVAIGVAIGIVAVP